MMSLVFFFATAVELVALTAAFAVGGFSARVAARANCCGGIGGPQVHAPLDWVFLRGRGRRQSSAFLAVGYEGGARIRARVDRRGELAALEPVVQAAALTTLAFIGIVIAFTSGYYRESVEAMGDAPAARLGCTRVLRTDQQHLEATRKRARGRGARVRAAATRPPALRQAQDDGGVRQAQDDGVGRQLAMTGVGAGRDLRMRCGVAGSRNGVAGSA